MERAILLETDRKMREAAYWGRRDSERGIGGGRMREEI